MAAKYFRVVRRAGSAVKRRYVSEWEIRDEKKRVKGMKSVEAECERKRVSSHSADARSRDWIS
jgi:uncharacterized protein YabE (DUF348 family)